MKKKGASRQQPHYIRWFFSITREGAWGQDRAWRPGDKHELHPGFIDLFFLVFWFRFSLILIFFAIFSFRFFQTEHYGEKMKTGWRMGLVNFVILIDIFDAGLSYFYVFWSQKNRHISMEDDFFPAWKTRF